MFSQHGILAMFNNYVIGPNYHFPIFTWCKNDNIIHQAESHLTLPKSSEHPVGFTTICLPILAGHIIFIFYFRESNHDAE